MNRLFLPLFTVRFCGHILYDSWTSWNEWDNLIPCVRAKVFRTKLHKNRLTRICSIIHFNFVKLSNSHLYESNDTITEFSHFCWEFLSISQSCFHTEMTCLHYESTFVPQFHPLHSLLKLEDCVITIFVQLWVISIKFVTIISGPRLIKFQSHILVSIQYDNAIKIFFWHWGKELN